MRLILVTLIACFALAHAITYNDLLGVWTTQTADSGTQCRHDIQFFVSDFTMMTTGPQCDTLGPWFGTYAIDGDDLWVQWAYEPVNLNKVTLERMTCLLQQNNMMQFTMGAGSADAHTIQLIKANGTNFDGVWNGASSIAQGNVQRFHVNSDLFEFFTNQGQSSSSGLGAFLGYITSINGNSLNDATLANLTYAYAPSSLQGLLASPSTIGWNTTVPNQLHVSMLQPFAQTFDFIQKVGTSDLDGTFVGSNNNCYDTFEIITGLFRHYTTGCFNSSNMFVSGPLDIINSTHLILNFAFSSLKNFGWLGQSKIFPYKLNTNQGPSSTNQLGLVGYLDQFLSSLGTGLTNAASGNSGGTFSAFKVQNPPLATTATLTLAAEFASWTAAAEQSVLTALSQAVGLNLGNIKVLSRAAGSVVLNLLMIDDQVQGKFAHDAVTTLQNMASIGGYTIQGVGFSSSGGTFVTSTGGEIFIPPSSSGGSIVVAPTGSYSGMEHSHALPIASSSRAATFASVAALLIAALL